MAITNKSKNHVSTSVPDRNPMKVDGLDSEALLKDLYGDITTEKEYDVTEDPAYSSLKKAAYRESDRTMRDVLAQGNARTNGYANSAAITAASQARDYKMSQFDDQIAELEDRALAKQQSKISMKMQLLEALEGMEATKRQNYLAELERLEQQENEAKSAAETEAMNIIKMGGIPSDELMSRAGWSAEYIKNVKNNVYNNMDTAAMQQFLNEHGAKLTVDGKWGSGTEAAYKKYFGKSSGRQEYFASTGGSGTSGSGRSSGSNTKNNLASDPVPKTASNYDTARNYLGTTGLSMSAKAKNDFINEAVESGELTKEEGKKLKQYIGSAR